MSKGDSNEQRSPKAIMIFDGPPRPTLVRYSEPEVSPVPPDVKVVSWDEVAQSRSTTYFEGAVTRSVEAGRVASGAVNLDEADQKLTQLNSNSRNGGRLSVEEVLETLFPPRQWVEGDRLYTQKISTIAADRADVQKTQELLDQELIRRHASELGICPIRYELVLQCFDELIRQIAIQCPERALLLLRLKEEMRMTVGAYETLVDATIVFSARKQMLSELADDGREEEVKELEEENKRLEAQIANLRRQTEALEAEEATKLQALRTQHLTEVEHHQQQLAFLKSVLINTQNTNGKAISISEDPQQQQQPQQPRK